MTKNICVFCSSSDKIDARYFKTAEELGRTIGQRKGTLIYGGGNVGLMGAVARAVHKSGGRVMGIIPVSLKERELAYKSADELVVTEDMRDRKTLMEKNSDGFVVLPGGFGTIEEFMEILTLKQLRYHNKPLVFLNAHGFYDGLFDFFEKLYRENFAKPERKKLYFVADSVESAFSHLENY